MLKILKHMNPVFRMFTPKNISNDYIWDRGPIEYDTTQLSSLSNLLIAYQKKSFLRNVETHLSSISDVYPSFFDRMTKNPEPAYSPSQRASFSFLIRFSA